MADRLRAVTEQEFQSEVLDSAVPVLVDFYADWCAPCRMIEPIVEEVADDFAGRVEIRKADLDKMPRIAARFGVRSIPTLMVFKDGSPQDILVGAVAKSRLTELLDRYL